MNALLTSSSPSSTSIDRGLLVLRFALGLVFVLHGWQKITVFGFSGVYGFLATLGVPFPGLNAVILMAVELGGGLALLAGLGTRISAALISFSMLVATVAAHGAGGFFLPTGYEFSLTLMLAGLALVFTGAGGYSLDAKFFARTQGAGMPSVRLAA